MSCQDEAPTTKKQKRWRWSSEKVDNLLKCLCQLKSIYELKGVDIQSDLPKLYSEVREKMASLYESNDFGPVQARTINQDSSTGERAKRKITYQEDIKAIKVGYDRIKQKIKDIRQDYRKAVTEGRRSGSGQLVCDNWDVLKELWGGSPATHSLKNAIDTLDGEERNEEEFDENEQRDEEDNEQDKTEANDCTEKDPNLVSPTRKYVDNKRKLLEKQLSASQRDQVYLNVARDELKIKQKMVDSLTEATQESNNAFIKISESIASVGKSIGEGLALMASALSGTMSQQVSAPPADSYNGYSFTPNVHYRPNNNLPTPNSSMSSSSSSMYPYSPVPSSRNQDTSQDFPVYENM